MSDKFFKPFKVLPSDNSRLSNKIDSLETRLDDEGWHTIQTGPPLKFDHSKQEMIAGVIADLIDSGLDEDAHFRNRFITSDSLKPSDFRDIVTDIEKLDALMSMVRDHIIVTLKKVADDLEKHG